eukprot:3251092-Alexandrium_andersonii.AAC.1
MTHDPNLVVSTLQRVNGHRGGSEGYSEQAAIQLEQMGLKRGILHPCGSASPDKQSWAAKHVGDGVLEGKPE